MSAQRFQFGRPIALRVRRKVTVVQLFLMLTSVIAMAAVCDTVYGQALLSFEWKGAILIALPVICGVVVYNYLILKIFINSFENALVSNFEHLDERYPSFVLQSALLASIAAIELFATLSFAVDLASGSQVWRPAFLAFLIAFLMLARIAGLIVSAGLGRLVERFV